MRIAFEQNISIIVSFTALLFGYVLARLLYNHAMLISVLMAGMPLLLLVPFAETRRLALILLIALVPLTGIFKPLTGIRYAPVTFDIAILLACVFDLIDRILQRNLRFDILDYLMGAFWVLALLQMFNPNVPGLRAGIEGFRKFAYMSVTFYAGRHILELDDLKLFQKLVLPISTGVALYGLKQFFYLSEFDYNVLELATGGTVTYFMGGWLRPFSILSGPFHLGLYLLITIIFTSNYLMDENKQFPARILMLLALSVQLVTLYTTRTKRNWIALSVGIVFLMIYQRNRLKISYLIGGIGFISIIISLLIWATPSEDASSLLLRSMSYAMNPLEAPTFQIRLELWKHTIIPALKSRPLMGYGTSSAGEGLSHLYRGTLNFHFFSHNQYFKVFLELGVMGFLLFLSVIFNSLFNAHKQIRKADNVYNEDIWWVKCIMAVIVAILISGLAGAILDAAPISYYFWLLLGFISKKPANRTANDEQPFV